MERKAVTLESPRGAIRVVAAEAQAPAPGEVLLRLEAGGICHSDLFVASLEKLPLAPLTLGHEGIGRVVALGGGVSGFSCGECALCRAGRERFCARQKNTGYTVHGVLASFAAVPAQHLARVPDALHAAEAAPLCCAGWTAYGALREAGLQSGQSAALFGMGGLGHLAVQYARHLGLTVAAADISEEKLAQASALGAAFTAPAAAAGRAIQKEFGGADASIVFTGSPDAVQQAFRAVKRTGTVVLVGLSSNDYALPIVDHVLRGVTVKGSYLGTRRDLDDVFRLAAEGKVRPHVAAYPIEEAPALLEKLKRGALIGRAVITFA
jgi:propanol-preferring alcohol dehydrogenase